jgi:hypothetical protein
MPSRGQTDQLERQLDSLRKLRVDFVRTNLDWSLLEPARGRFDFSATDPWVEALARRGLRWQVTGQGAPTPAWARDPEAVAAGCDYRSPPADGRDFAAMMAAVARRYGRGGSFWREHPDLPRQPIHQVRRAQLLGLLVPAARPRGVRSDVLRDAGAGARGRPERPGRLRRPRRLPGRGGGFRPGDARGRVLGALAPCGPALAGPGTPADPGVTSLAALPRTIAEAIALDQDPWQDDPCPPGVAIAEFVPPGPDTDDRWQAFADWGLDPAVAGPRVGRSLRAATDGRLKLQLRGGDEELFDLDDDPLELEPRPPSIADPAAVGRLRAALNWSAGESAAADALAVVPKPEISVEARQKLEDRMRLLGYM